MSGLLVLTWLLPLCATLLSQYRLGAWWVPVAPLGGLIAALILPIGGQLDIDWLLLGVSLHLDAIGQTFLLFSSTLWLFAGCYATLTMRTKAHFGRFSLFFLLACSGNLLLIVAADIVTFYLGFALMGLAATGMILHPRSQRARRGARIYLLWTLVGELALFSAIVLLAHNLDSLRFSALTTQVLTGTTAALLLFGFGIKLALPGLHFWLPLTYPVAPAAAAAVLSGPMISAGLLGWLRFLSPGNAMLISWGEGLLVIGVIGTTLGVLAGLLQRHPRAVLAYSSIAKMGLVTTIFGLALAKPAVAPEIIAALVVFAMHHLMLKGTLFLLLGEWLRQGARVWITLTIGILALAMIGVPLTSGAGAKLMLKGAVAQSGVSLTMLFGFSVLGTLFLMAKLLWLVARRPVTKEPAFDYSGISVIGFAAIAVLLPLSQMPLPMHLSGIGTIIAGLIMIAVFIVIRRNISFSMPTISQGDLLYLFYTVPRLCCGRISWRDFTLSPYTLLLVNTDAITARAPGALIWLALCVSFLTLALMPR